MQLVTFWKCSGHFKYPVNENSALHLWPPYRQKTNFSWPSHQSPQCYWSSFQLLLLPRHVRKALQLYSQHLNCLLRVSIDMRQPLPEIWLYPSQKILQQNYNHRSKNSCGLTHFCPASMFLKRWGETCPVGTGALEVGCRALQKPCYMAVDWGMRQCQTYWPWTLLPLSNLSAAGTNLLNLGKGGIFPRVILTRCYSSA